MDTLIDLCGRGLLCHMVQCVWTPEVWGEGLRPHSGLSGSLSSQLLGSQQAMEAVQDAGKTHGFPPQGGRNGMDGTQLRNQDLTPRHKQKPSDTIEQAHGSKPRQNHRLWPVCSADSPTWPSFSRRCSEAKLCPSGSGVGGWAGSAWGQQTRPTQRDKLNKKQQTCSCFNTDQRPAHLEEVWSTSSSGWFRLDKSRLYLVL